MVRSLFRASIAANLRIGWDWNSLLPHLRGCEQLASTPDPYPSLSESKDHVVGSGDPEPHGKSGLVKVRNDIHSLHVSLMMTSRARFHTMSSTTISSRITSRVGTRLVFRQTLTQFVLL